MAEGARRVKQRPEVCKAPKQPLGMASCIVCGDDAARIIHFPQRNVVTVITLCELCVVELRKQLK